MDNPIVELIGYSGSVLVAISLSMSRIIRLRWFNLFGSGFFSLYGFLIQAYPVGILNGYIAITNLFYLKKMYASNEDFHVLSLDQDNKYLDEFFQYYQWEILRFFPDFDFTFEKSDEIYVILRNMMPAGIIIGHTEDHQFDLKIDFVIPRFRDFKVGEYVYRDRFLNNEQIQKVVTETENKKQSKYYKKMGFVQKGKQFIYKF